MNVKRQRIMSMMMGREGFELLIEQIWNQENRLRVLEGNPDPFTKQELWNYLENRLKNMEPYTKPS